MPRHAGRCPQCGEPVSAFAAGCAICGADLERHRAEQAARRAQRRAKVPDVPVPSVRLPALDDDWLFLGLTVVLVLFAPLFGLVLAVIGARDPVRANRRTAFVVLALLAVAIMVLPATRYGIWYLLA
jgi:hypothetical protein